MLSKEIQELDNLKSSQETNSPLFSNSSSVLPTNFTSFPNAPQIKKNPIPSKEKMDEFSIPPVSQAYDIDANIELMSEVGSGWLLSDGREDIRIKTIAGHVSSKNKTLIPLRADPSLKQDLAEYRENQKK